MMTTAPAWAPTCTASPEGKTQTRSYLIQTASERQSATIGPQRRQADIETHTEALKPRLPCNQIASIEINTTQKKKKCFWLHGLEVTLVKNEVWQKRKPLLRAHVHISFWGQKSAWELREKNTARRLVSVITIPWQPWHCPFAVLIDIRTSVARRTWVHDIICMRQITLNINASAGKKKKQVMSPAAFWKSWEIFNLKHSEQTRKKGGVLGKIKDAGSCTFICWAAVCCCPNTRSSLGTHETECCMDTDPFYI